MIWLASLALGIVLGIVFFGGLWLTVQAVLLGPRATGLVLLSQMARLLIMGAGLAFVFQQGPGASLAAICGLFVSRWYLLQRLGEGKGAV